MTYYGYEFIRESDLTHHGIKGQKWGIRRFQNKDGSLTAAGKKRRGNIPEESKHMSDKTKANLKKAAKIGGAVAGTALLAYGAYKVNQIATDRAIANDIGRGKAALVRAYQHKDQWWTLKELSGRWDTLRDSEKSNRYAAEARDHYYTAKKAEKDARKYINQAVNGKYSISEKARALAPNGRKNSSSNSSKRIWSNSMNDDFDWIGKRKKPKDLYRF